MRISTDGYPDGSPDPFDAYHEATSLLGRALVRWTMLEALQEKQEHITLTMLDKYTKGVEQNEATFEEVKGKILDIAVVNASKRSRMEAASSTD